MGKVKILKRDDLEIEYISGENREEEVKRFHKACSLVEKKLLTIRQKVSKEIGEEEARIFDAQNLILKDPSFIKAVERNILEKNLSAISAIKKAVEEISAMFENIQDEYIKERIQDVKDVAGMVIENMKDEKKEISSEIILTEEVYPSFVTQIEKLKGIICKKGGETSHSAIIARSKEIPMIQIPDIEMIKDGDFVIVDCEKGEIILNPESSLIEYYRNLELQKEKEKEELLELKDLPAITKDGRVFKILANISHPGEIETCLKYNADGIGLFRTEFLYLNREKPISEDEQFRIYLRVAERFKDKPVTIRTFDLGGDKNISYLQLPVEENPFLGLRGIRLAFKFREIFEEQLRAILRASGICKNIQILLPMVSTLEEVKKAKEIIENLKEQLKRKEISYNEKIKIGIMIEVPSAAIISDILAKEVDFFSIGTNDLIQYILAVDRNNENVNYLYNSFDISILKTIKEVIKNAKSNNVKVSMCGEMASDLNAIPYLVKYGLEEFSVEPNCILKIKKAIRELPLT